MPAAARNPGGEIHQSLAMPALVHGLRSGHHRILDLGPAVGTNVDFFSRLPCTLFIADLHEELFPRTSMGVVRRRDHFPELLEEELPSAESFDLILAWDLLNYLEAIEIRSLSRRLGKSCAPGSVLFAFINTRKSMPNKPGPFRILDSEQLGYETTASTTRAAPSYKEPDLERMMPEFEVESTFLLRNGMQEYLFSRRPEA
jgi:hypothetical protein